MVVNALATGYLSRPLPWWTWPARRAGEIRPALAAAVPLDVERLERLHVDRALPIAVVLVGAAFGALRPGIRDVYTESLPFLLIAMALGFLSPTLGVLFVASFAPIDLLHSLDDPFRGVGGRLVSYWVLWLLVVESPLAGRAFATAGAKGAELVSRVATSLIMPVVLVYIWTLAEPLLIRPVYIWANKNPQREAMEIAQTHAVWLLAPAAMLSVAAFALQLMESRSGVTVSRNSRLDALPPLLRHFLSAVLGVIALGGLITAPLDATILVSAFLAAPLLGGAVARERGFGEILKRIPATFVFLIAFAVVALVARVIDAPWFSGSQRPPLPTEFFPLVVATAIGILVFGLLSINGRFEGRRPGSRPERTVVVAVPKPGESRRELAHRMFQTRANVILFHPHPGAGNTVEASQDASPASSGAPETKLFAVLVATAVMLGLGGFALADNCGNLDDCYSAAPDAAALAAAAAAAAVALRDKPSPAKERPPSSNYVCDDSTCWCFGDANCEDMFDTSGCNGQAECYWDRDEGQYLCVCWR